MPLILPGNVGSATAATGYDVANSCRFNDGDSAYMNLTSVGTVTNRLKFTISLWVKRSTLGAKSMIGTVGGDSSNFGAIWFDSSDRLNCTEGSGGGTLNFITNRVFRDTSAWYNIILAIDTTQGTEANRVKIYVNGVQETSFSTSTYPGEDSNMHLNRGGKAQYLGRHTDSTNDYYFDGYMAEVVWIDGSQEAPTSFGEFDSDSGIWKPIDPSGLTFGNNGFYLDFEASGNLGNDANGGTDWTETNFAATDQSTDTCTNNFATINPLDNYYAQATLSEGNTKVATNASAEAMSTSTFAMTKGRWYFEVDFISNSGNVSRQCGITPHPSKVMSGISGKSGDVTPHTHAFSDSGNVQTGNGSGGQTALASLSSFTNGDIIGIYMDLEDMKSYWSKNGSLMNSGTGLDLTALASNGTGHYMFYVGDNNSAAQTCQANFGNPHLALDNTAVADDNGYGAFEYSPNITGDGTSKKFYSCCTKNLAEFG